MMEMGSDLCPVTDVARIYGEFVENSPVRRTSMVWLIGGIAVLWLICAAIFISAAILARRIDGQQGED